MWLEMMNISPVALISLILATDVAKNGTVCDNDEKEVKKMMVSTFQLRGFVLH